MVVQFFINKNYNNQFVFGYKGEQMIDYNYILNINPESTQVDHRH